MPELTYQRQKIQTQLVDLFCELSGMGRDDVDVHASLLELGADSLLLVHASQAIQDIFNIKLPLRVLIEEDPSLDSLTAYIDERYTPEASSMPTPMPSPVAATPTNGHTVSQTLVAEMSPRQTIDPSTSLTQLVTQQIEIMSKQLDLLRRSHPEAAPSTSPIAQQYQLLNDTQKMATEGTQVDVSQPQTLNGTKTDKEDAKETEKVYIPYKPIEVKKSKDGLTEIQQQYISSLVDRLANKTKGSKQLAQVGRAHLADSRGAAGFRLLWKEALYPLHVARAADAKIWDVDGNEYIDITMGFGALLFGHSPSFLIDVLQNQIAQGIQLGLESPLASQAARLICEQTGVERATFCNSGTEAVMTALRLARTVTERDKVALFAGAYHGFSDGVLIRSGRSTNGYPHSMPMAPGVPHNIADNVMVLDYNDPTSLDILQKYGHQLAAVLVEPIQSRRPNLQPVTFLQKVREITQQTGTALIFDEVITGFRSHPGGAQALFNIQADIVTYGKTVGAGIPVGVVAGKARYLDAIDGGMWQYGDASYPKAERTFFAGTFFKNPLTMSAIYAVLNHLKREGPALQENLNQRTARLVKRLNTFFIQEQLPIEMVYFSSLFRFVFDREVRYADLLFYHLVDKGIYVWEGRNLFLSTAHTDADIDYLIQAIQESALALREVGLLPSKTDKKSSPALESATDKQIPLTIAQKELWILAQMDQEASRAYNESVALHLKGLLDRNTLQRAIHKTVARHEALRLTFATDGTHQHIAATLSLDIPFIDFTQLPETQREAEIAAWLEDEAYALFDLVQGPLIRVSVGQVAADHHILVLTLHHIITDGWSNAVLVRDIAELYSAERNHSPSTLPAVMQFSQYVAWQDAQQQSQAISDAETYWLQQFQTYNTPLDLPTDNPRPAVQTYQGSRVYTTIESDLVKALQKFGAKHKATLFVTLLTAFKVLLHRLSGQDDLLVGTVSAGQLAAGDKNLVGYCVNLLPIRTQVTKETSFVTFLNTVRQQLLDAFEHQEYPYGLLIRKLALARDPSRPPLVNVIFNMDRKPLSGPQLHNITAEMTPNPPPTAKYDLNLNITQLGNELQLEWEYNTNLFNATTSRQWLRYFKTLLTNLLSHSEQTLAHIQLLAAKERHQLIVDWNATATAYSNEGWIHQRFAAQAIRNPAKTAVIFEDTQLTYQTLNERTNQLAHYLQSQGVGPETLVGVCMERSVEMVVALIGILKAGGAYVPLDPTHPSERLIFMVDDAHVAMLLTQSHLVPLITEIVQTDRIDAIVPPVIALDTIWEVIAQEPNHAPTCLLHSDNLAYMIYTSGSTGKPKGAMNTHTAILNRLLWMQEAYSLDETDTVLQKTPFSFDVSVWEFFWPLLAGATLVVAKPEGHKDNTYLVDTIVKHHITTMHFVPSMLQLFVADSNITQCHSLRRIICSGEALTADLTERFHATVDAELHNLYGPTEAAIDVTYWPCHKESALTTIPIGRPIANTQIYLLDPHGYPTPIGVAGELHIGGVGLARGYHHRAMLTAERFVPNPFSHAPGARLYKTGDLARYLPDGNIEFLGRIDFQVKLRGFRVELGEIEATITRHAMVQDTAVTLYQQTPENQRLVAYVMVAPESTEVIDAQQTTETAANVVTQWQQFTDEAYKPFTQAATDSITERDLTTDVIRWINSYTGLPMPPDEVRDQVDGTVARFLRLAPRRVLEIGCGIGMMLFRIAPHCELYKGTDFSHVAVDYVQQQLNKPTYQMPHVSVVQQQADDFQGIDPHVFDAILLNSVVQYFPSVDYLLDVLEQAVAVTAPGGFIFIGDVRNRSLFAAFHATVQLTRADASLPIPQVYQQMHHHMEREDELLYDPAFFIALKKQFPRITHVQMELKRGHYENELSQFRYDVILHIEAEGATQPQQQPLNWQQENLSVESVQTLLTEEVPDILYLTDVPNARLTTAINSLTQLKAPNDLNTLADLRQSLQTVTNYGVMPEDLWALGDLLAYNVYITWSGSGATGAMDVYFQHQKVAHQLIEVIPFTLVNADLMPIWQTYVNDPLHNQRIRDLVPQLRQFVKEKLPDYMVPTHFVIMKQFPLMPNGKLNRRALPLPDNFQSELNTTYVAPQTDIEQKIAQLMQEILQIEQVGLHDNFFDLGGHSLLLIKLHQKLEETFGKNLVTIELFKYPTVKLLAQYLTQKQEDKQTYNNARERGKRLRRAAQRPKLSRI